VQSGPCYAITANKLLDYFGQTVNIAARLQGIAASDEIIVPSELAATARQSGWLGAAEIADQFTCSLKGLDVETHAARLRLRPPAPSSPSAADVA
jgi:class 3 adenylate cyclase